MQETVDQYKKRLLGYLGDQDPLEVQRRSLRELQELIAHRDQDELHRKPAPDRWSAAEITAHLAEYEIIYGHRIRSALAASGTSIAPFDPDRWAEVIRYNETPAAVWLDRFLAGRRWNLAVQESLTGEEWQRYGMHAERGRESVADMARMCAGHDLNHLQQIRRLLI